MFRPRPAHALWLGPQTLVARRLRLGRTAEATEPVVLHAVDLDPAGGGQASIDGTADLAPNDSSTPRPAAEALFETWCRRHPASRCDLLLSAHLVHSRVLDDADAAGRPQAVLEGRARRLWAALHGASALAWTVAIGEGLRPRRGAATFIACAPDGLDLSRIEASARRHDVRLRSVQPAWCAAWTRSFGRRASGRLAVFEPGAVTWLGLHDGGCTAVVRQRVGADVAQDDAALAALLHAAPLPDDTGAEADEPADPGNTGAEAAVPPDGTVAAPAARGETASPGRWRLDGHALGARAPAGATVHADAARPWPRLDAARPGRGAAVPEFFAERGPRPLAWCALALGAVALGSALLARADAAARRDTARTRFEALSRADGSTASSMPRGNGNGSLGMSPSAEPTPQRSPEPPRTRAGRSGSDAGVDLGAARTVRTVAARLRHPWGALVGGVEGALNPGVRLTDLAHDATSVDTAGRSTVQVAGVAIDALALDDFVEALSATAGLSEVVLRRQSPWLRGPAGGVEFDIAATLPAPRGAP